MIPEKRQPVTTFEPGDRVNVALLSPFVGTILGRVAGRETEDIWEVAAPADWCVRANETRIQNVFGRNLTKIVPETTGVSVREAGRRGGEAVKAKHGTEHYREIGRKGGQATKDKHGPEFYERIGHMGGTKGGTSTVARHGPEFYKAIGKKGGARMKALIAAGKAALRDG
jgi:general stress protein YciG